MILSDKIHDHLANLTAEQRHAWIEKQQRTVIKFRNGSRIVALPCSENLLRGYTADVIICFPQYVKVALADGTQIPISQIKPGDVVLSFNFKNNKLEPRRVLRVHRNPLNNRPIVRIVHEYGWLDCTADHKIFVLKRGFVRAKNLKPGQELFILKNITKCAVYPLEALQQTSIQAKAYTSSRTGDSWKLTRRFINSETKKKWAKLPLKHTAFIKTSRVRLVEIFDPERICPHPAERRAEQGMGKENHTFFNTCTSSVHRDLQLMLQKRGENDNGRVVKSNKPSNRLGRMVYGRWKLTSKLHINYQHPQIYIRRTKNASEVAKGKVGYSSQNKKGLAWKRILPSVSGRRKREFSESNKTIHYSLYDIQDFSAGTSTCKMRSLWKTIQTKTKCLLQGVKEKLESLLFQRMRKVCLFTTSLQSSANFMQSMRKNICPSHGEPSYLLQGMQLQIPSDKKERMEQSLQVEKKIEVYDLEVEENHNYFANGVLVSNCDEANFFEHDEDIFYSILMPMLATTDGTLIVSSTPWNRDSVFYRFYNDPAFSKHVVTWRDAVKCGLMKAEFIEQMQNLLPLERFQREFEAKFVEDVDAWLPQSLIVKCIDSMLEPYGFSDSPNGSFYVGVDFGKHQDYSVVAVAEREDDIIKIVHVHRFPLETEYASVIGYIKSLCDRWRVVRAVYADVTGVGDYIVEDMRKSGILNVNGVLFTVRSKEEMATILKEAMRCGRLKIPYTPAKSIRDIDLTAELNVERFELTKTGHIKFSHPENTHDDVFWAVALAVYAASQSVGALEVSTGRVWR